MFFVCFLQAERKIFLESNQVIKKGSQINDSLDFYGYYPLSASAIAEEALGALRVVSVKILCAASPATTVERT